MLIPGWCLSVRSFQCIPLQPPSVRQKPCLFIWTQFEDHNFRLYQANWLNKMADRMVGVTVFNSTLCATWAGLFYSGFLMRVWLLSFRRLALMRWRVC